MDFFKFRFAHGLHSNSQTETHKRQLTEVFKQIFAVVSCHVMNSAITLIPPLDVLFTVAAQHPETLLYTRNSEDKQKICFLKAQKTFPKYTVKVCTVCLQGCNHIHAGFGSLLIFQSHSLVSSHVCYAHPNTVAETETHQPRQWFCNLLSNFCKSG